MANEIRIYNGGEILQKGKKEPVEVDCLEITDLQGDIEVTIRGNDDISFAKVPLSYDDVRYLYRCLKAMVGDE